MDNRVEKHLTLLMVNRSGDIRHEFRWEHEKALLEAIRAGRSDLLEEILSSNRPAYDQTIPDVHFSDRPANQGLYRFISAVTLFCRAAIEGGLPESLAYSMMESYIYCADKYGADLFADALFSFAGAVSDRRSGGPEISPEIRRIKAFVMENLTRPVTLRMIAGLLHLSPSRCSHLFKEKTGMTIHEYIERERVRAACAHLYYTDMEISGVSEYLTFSSPSHFAAVFKKHTGKTPTEWRRENQGREHLS